MRYVQSVWIPTVQARPSFLGFFYSVPALPRRMSSSLAGALGRTCAAHIPPEDHTCLNQLGVLWREKKPLKNRSVLLNVHLTSITLLLIARFLESDALLEVIAAPPLVRHPHTVRDLAKGGISVLEVIPEEKRSGYYDLIYDCGAGMRRLTPRVGMVELTYTDPALYQSLPFPVVTVDRSLTKTIETGMGTGDSLVRLIHTLAPPPQTSSAHRFFSQSRWIIFGYGKVGQGLVTALEMSGAPRKNITVVEASWEAYVSVMKNGYDGVLLEEASSESGIAAIRTRAAQACAVITATGVKGLLSRYFISSDFEPVRWWINMGTDDEWGQNFSENRVLNQKRPANFLLDYPTAIKYLDPIFALLLEAGVSLLNSPLPPGLHPVARSLDVKILSQWFQHQRHDLWRYPRKSAALPASEPLAGILNPISERTHSDARIRALNA